MKRMLLTAAAIWMSCTQADVAESRGSDRPTAGVQVVESQVAAFNRGDVEAMSANVSDDVLLLAVSDDSIVRETRGRGAFEEQMLGYFESLGSVASVLEESIAIGPYVAVVERVAWDSQDGRRTATSLGVYEVREGSIRRAWYFPPVAE